jgi:hypothetical protein
VSWSSSGFFSACDGDVGKGTGPSVTAATASGSLAASAAKVYSTRFGTREAMAMEQRTVTGREGEERRNGARFCGDKKRREGEALLVCKARQRRKKLCVVWQSHRTPPFIMTSASKRRGESPGSRLSRAVLSFSFDILYIEGNEGSRVPTWDEHRTKTSWKHGGREGYEFKDARVRGGSSRGRQQAAGVTKEVGFVSFVPRQLGAASGMGRSVGSCEIVGATADDAAGSESGVRGFSSDADPAWRYDHIFSPAQFFLSFPSARSHVACPTPQRLRGSC